MTKKKASKSKASKKKATRKKTKKKASKKIKLRQLTKNELLELKLYKTKKENLELTAQRLDELFNQNKVVQEYMQATAAVRQQINDNSARYSQIKESIEKTHNISLNKYTYDSETGVLNRIKKN